MKRNRNGHIQLTDAEAATMAEFIDNSLTRAWDRYTDNYICTGVSLEDGKLRMDPEMYDFMKELRKL